MMTGVFIRTIIGDFRSIYLRIRKWNDIHIYTCVQMELFSQVLPTLHSEEASATGTLCNHLNILQMQKHYVADTSANCSVGNTIDILTE